MLWWLPTSVALFAFYAAMGVWLTWPLASHGRTHVPAIWNYPGDALLLAWSLTHQTRALVTDWSILPHPPVFYPEPYALFYGEAGFGALPLFAPVLLATGSPALALNVTFLAGVAATATAIHLATARFTGSWVAGLVGAWTFLTTHWVFWSWIPNAPNYAVLPYLPWIMLLASERLGWRRMLGLGALVVLQGLTSIYVAVATMLPLLVLGLLRLVRGAGGALLAVVTLAAVPLLAAYSGYLVVRDLNPNLSAQSVYAVVRAGRTSLPWGPFAPGRPMALPATAALLILAGGLLRVTRPRARSTAVDRGWSQGILWTVVGLAGSLTPVVLWYGRHVELPQAWLIRRLGIDAILRDPARVGIAGLMGLAVLTASGFAECVSRIPGPRARAVGRAALAIVVGVGFWRAYGLGLQLPGRTAREPLPAAYPIAAVPTTPPLVLRLLSEGHGPVLELPVGPGILPHAVAMYRALDHGCPLVNGYNGYWPARFRERMTVACRLPDPAALQRLREETGLRMILVDVRPVDPNIPGMAPYRCPPGPAARAAWAGVRNSGRSDLREVARVGHLWLFRVAEPSGQPAPG